MMDMVQIKSYQSGITLQLNETVEFSRILEELAEKFSQAKSFFKNASVALSIEGRKLSEQEERLLVDTIHDSSDVRVVCIVGHDEEKNDFFVKAIRKAEIEQTTGCEGQFFKGSLKNREVIETKSSIVILGDVAAGCAVISTGSIIILGGLYGEAYAGGGGDNNAYVVALEMEPERLKIGDFKYKPTKQGKWGIRPKTQPKIAYVKNKRILLEPLTKDIPSSF